MSGVSAGPHLGPRVEAARVGAVDGDAVDAAAIDGQVHGEGAVRSRERRLRVQHDERTRVLTAHLQRGSRTCGKGGEGHTACTCAHVLNSKRYLGKQDTDRRAQLVHGGTTQHGCRELGEARTPHSSI